MKPPIILLSPPLHENQTIIAPFPAETTYRGEEADIGGINPRLYIFSRNMSIVGIGFATILLTYSCHPGAWFTLVLRESSLAGRLRGTHNY